MHYSGNVPGNEHILATKVLMPLRGGCLGKCTIQVMSQGMSTFLLQKCSYLCVCGWGWGSGHMHYLANVPKKVLMPGNIPECHAISLPVISLLTCCQKEVLKACTCLYSQAARHSGILPPLLEMSTSLLTSARYAIDIRIAFLF